MDRIIAEDLAIKFSVLQKLPHGCTLIGLYETRDMGDNLRRAVKVLFRDRYARDLRKAFFCLETGEYLGDLF